MAWDEWEKLKNEAAQRVSAPTQLNGAPPGGGGTAADGDLVVHDDQLGKMGNTAYELRQKFGVDSDHARPSTFTASIEALLAAGTGLNPDVPAVVTGYDHTPEQREVLDKSLDLLADKKNDFPPELRDDMAALLANYGDNVHQSASSLDSGRSPLDYKDLLEVSKQVSRDQDAYGMLMEGVNQAIIADMHAPHEGDPKRELPESAGLPRRPRRGVEPHQSGPRAVGQG
ncbi:hypothetical protein [Streptomyces sp. WZ.A104]|uniref:hypothetical protein n=1 Tax=Streptomyces sp. WZ.A104 TaxID=2023771 RepID=UPI0015CDD5E6|nr:hypothetical protein [Streptomyces sp. WZ.A104]